MIKTFYYYEVYNNNVVVATQDSTNSKRYYPVSVCVQPENSRFGKGFWDRFAFEESGSEEPKFYQITKQQFRDFRKYGTIPKSLSSK